MKMSRNNWIDRLFQVKHAGRIPIIAEIKPCSPSAGELLGKRSIEDIAAAYEAGGAACISVITGRWFGGDINMLSLVAESSTLPLLRKDLIVTRDGIRESVDFGANAVLLTKKIMKARQLEKMIDQCISLDVTPFVEVSSLEEIKQFTPSQETIVAITNRDIATKEQDTHSGLKSLELIKEINWNYGPLISASGIKNNFEAKQLFSAGFDGLLVGTSLLRAEDPATAVASLAQIAN
jgi:indole-3-glycerol phosphate synthase